MLYKTFRVSRGLGKFDAATGLREKAFRLLKLTEQDLLSLMYPSGLDCTQKERAQKALKVFRKVCDADCNFSSVAMAVNTHPHCFSCLLQEPASQMFF